MLYHTYKKVKNITVIILLIFFMGCCFNSMPAFAAQSSGVKIIINNQALSFLPGEQGPVNIAGRTYVPLRIISEHLGAQVEWVSESRQVVICWRSESNAAIPVNTSNNVQILIDGNVLNISADLGKPYISTQGRTMIPLRAVGEALACEVLWNNGTGTVEISSKQTIEQPAVNPAEPDPTVPQTQEPAAGSDAQLLKDLAVYKTNLKLADGSVINSADLLNRSPSAFSAEQLAAFKTYLDQLSKYQFNIELPDGQVVNAADLSILGDAYLTAEQLEEWIENETPRLQAKQGAAFQPIPDLAELYIEIGEEYGIRGDIAFCQAAKETGYWQFTGSVKPWQNNYCGLYATGKPLTGQESIYGADPDQVSLQSGVSGAIFTSPAAGVEAHIQHLYAYATKSPLPAGKILLDPRFSLVSKGISPSWLKLNARWAVPGTTYGQSILFDYWLKAANC